MPRQKDPTQEEIRKLCDEILENETEEDLERRANRAGTPIRESWSVPEVSVDLGSYDDSFL